jgi:UDPglucose 6-dehydrogenase
VETPVVVDARLSLDAKKWRDAGWIYRAPGKP